MTTIHIAQDGTRSVTTTVLVREDVRDEAKRQGISLSGTLTEALIKKLKTRASSLQATSHLGTAAEL